MVDTWILFCAQPLRFVIWLLFPLLVCYLCVITIFFIPSQWFEEFILRNAPLLLSKTEDTSFELWQFDTVLTLTLLVILILRIAACYFCRGNSYRQIALTLQHEMVPQRPTWKLIQQTLKDAWRMFRFDVAILSLPLLIVAVIVALAFQFSLWLLCLLIPLWMYVDIISTVARMHYVLLSENLRTALSVAFRQCHQRFGAFLTVRTLTTLLLLSIMVVACTPLTPFWMGVHANVHSNILYGMSSGISTLAVVMQAGLTGLALLICYWAWSMCQWPIALLALSEEIQPIAAASHETTAP